VTGLTTGDALRALAVTRLAHFTPAFNLWHILEDEQIRSSKDLAENAPDYFGPTDFERFDRNPDKVCCSFEYPNGYYLSKARKKPHLANYPDWVCLLLDRELLLRPGTLFCSCNAATGSGAYQREGGPALLGCFAPVASPNAEWTRGRRHHPGAATDLQAEALIPGPVELSHLQGIVVPAAQDAQSLFGTLNRYRLRPERFRWKVAPIFFDRDSLPRRVRFGGRIDETDWEAPASLDTN
jgi:hypothetical protein